ncbi:hypothetical protein HDU96_005266 [Phlyctochytrium bullatum]|nr:hypothetical protein HDU96_005266 [Phlyctochytrium bullatum]
MVPVEDSESQSIDDPPLNFRGLEFVDSMQRYPLPLKAGNGNITATEMHEVSAASSEKVLRKCLKRDGYLLVRGALEGEHILEARRAVLDDLKEHGFIRDSTEAGILLPDGKLPSLLDRQDLAHHPKVQAVLENSKLRTLATKLLQLDDTERSEDGPSRKKRKRSKAAADTAVADGCSEATPSLMTIPFKWLRAVPKDLYTGPHLDRVYLGAGSQRLLTIWMPLGDLTAEQGTLVVAAGSHRLPRFKRLREEYGQRPAGKDGTKSGWITEDPAQIPELYDIEGGIEWVAADLKAGDLIVLGLDVLHMSSTNCTDDWRLSVETRWQPAGDAYPPWFK